MSEQASEPQRPGWEDAIFCFQRERALAEIAARLLKGRDMPEAVALLSNRYEGVRVEFNVVLDSLGIALARRPNPPALPDVARNLWRAFDKRQAFCRTVRSLVQAQTEEQQALLEEAGKGSIMPLLAATHALWRYKGEADEPTRLLIGERLREAMIAEFTAVAPEPAGP